jgi:hypothetical protein
MTQQHQEPAAKRKVLEAFERNRNKCRKCGVLRTPEGTEGEGWHFETFARLDLSDQGLLEVVMCHMDLRDMMRVLPGFARDHSSRWIQFLRDLSPFAALVITNKWDTSHVDNIGHEVCEDELRAFFETIFAPFGEDGQLEVRKVLLQKNNEFAKSVLQSQIRRIAQF